MPRQLTFLHASDLHLGAPFRGLRSLSDEWADRLVEALAEAYDRVIETAIDRSVDFVVVAGDIFDEARSSYADYRRFFSGMERLRAAGIPAYLCTGNHDPYSLWEQDFFALPDNVFMFSASAPDFALYRKDGEPWCVLGGRSFPHSVWPPSEKISDGITRARAEGCLGDDARCAPFGVGVLHTGLTFDMMKAPSDPVELRAAGFDYWALGHIHRHYVDDEVNPRISFSGCIQGRDVRETGPRGVSVVTLTEGGANVVEFVPTARVAWEQVSVDVSACRSVSEIAPRIMRALFAANAHARCDHMVSRVTLTGETELHDLLSRPGVIEDVRKAVNDSHVAFFADLLKDETVLPLDRDALREEGLFPSVLLGVADEMGRDEDACRAYLQQEFLRRGISLPPVPLDDIEALSREAAEDALGLLVEGGLS